MPKYTYECEQCGEFSQRQEITDDPTEECPTCGEPVERIITGLRQGLIYGKDIEHMSDSDREKYHKDPERARRKREQLGL
jgi:putative FmdB family regulatory protein